MPDKTRCLPIASKGIDAAAVAGLCQHIVGNEEEDDKDDDRTGTPGHCSLAKKNL